MAKSLKEIIKNHIVIISIISLMILLFALYLLRDDIGIWNTHDVYRDDMVKYWVTTRWIEITKPNK